ncbi:hypothetical protein B0H16DRAFT_1549668 [Mycena metata]|uniref:Uncharacterized protein n=1 Tax=Mycena metata TaxID=1033252 RepID=A0AAD7IW85_9AGAR|nr:hypothetical protein B0H16DRAFT_1549668 [Mycena metata]
MTPFWFDMSDLWIGTFFYGIYLALFCICIYILLRRPHNLGNIVLLVTAVVLFTLSTVLAVLNLILGSGEIDNLNIPFDHLEAAGNIIYGVNNIVADGLVIYRCYSIWEQNIYVVILPIILLVLTSVFGVDLRLPSSPFFALSFATNVLVTALTAGRIWWLYRKAQVYLKADVKHRYLSAIGITVESGVLYSATVLAYLILGAIPGAEIVQGPIFQMLTQVMGIAPTLIIVRVGLGVNVQTSSRDTSTDLEKGRSF